MSPEHPRTRTHPFRHVYRIVERMIRSSDVDGRGHERIDGIRRRRVEQQSPIPLGGIRLPKRGHQHTTGWVSSYSAELGSDTPTHPGPVGESTPSGVILTEESRTGEAKRTARRDEPSLVGYSGASEAWYSS